jgi:hypothetical protein
MKGGVSVHADNASPDLRVVVVRNSVHGGFASVGGSAERGDYLVAQNVLHPDKVGVLIAVPPNASAPQSKWRVLNNTIFADQALFVHDFLRSGGVVTPYSLALRESVPDDFVVQNNVIAYPPESNGGLFPASISALENPKPGWSFSPNGYSSEPTATGSVKLTRRDVVEGDSFVASDPEMLRQDGLMGRHGANEAVPCHLGAIPAGPSAPDWLRTLRQWRDAASADLK